MLMCKGCGANVRYDIATGMMKCDHCGGSTSPYEYDSVVRDAQTEKYFDAAVYTCPQCGAELVTAGKTDITSVCSYCGGANIIFDRMSAMKRPSAIIPFAVDKEKCKEIYREAAKKAFFASDNFKKDSVIDSFRGIYMPYWSYSVRQKGKACIEVKNPGRRVGNYIYTDKFLLEGDVSSQSTGIAHDASRAFDDALSESLAPYDIKESFKFSPGYLSGFYADAADAESTYYDDDICDFIEDDTVQRLQKTSKGEPYARYIDAKSVNIPAEVTNAECVYFPVWFMSVRHGTKVTYAAVNGRTGKLAASFPVDPKKALGAILALALILFLLLNLLVMPTPSATLIVTALLALPGYILYKKEYNKVIERLGTDYNGPTQERFGWVSRERYNKNDPAGVKSGFAFMAILLTVIIARLLFVAIEAFNNNSNPAESILSAVPWCVGLVFIITAMAGKHSKKKDGKKKTGNNFPLLLTLLSIGLCALILIIKPLNIYYYITSLGITVFLALLLWQTARLHNRLMEQLPPQFNKKGGDDNA